MAINPSSKEEKSSQAAEALHHFESAHREDLEAITQVLVKITKRPAEQIKPHLDAMLEQLVEPKERRFYETATPEERAHAFREWAESHDWNTPLLSDYAVSRESMYDDERL
jgi:hypothetical protein